MYQPYRPNQFSSLPIVVKNLLILNVIAFLAIEAINKTGFAPNGFESLKDLLGLHYFPSEKFKPFQLVTYLFMHHDIVHLLMNMLALWVFGVTLENYWGPKKFLLFYLITGLGAALTHYMMVYLQFKPMLDTLNMVINSNDINTLEDFFTAYPEVKSYYGTYVKMNSIDHISIESVVDFLQWQKIQLLNAPRIIGASGSVFGILFAFGYLFPDTFISIIPIKAKYLVALYTISELVAGIQLKQGDPVAHFAHLGGVLFGFIVLRFFWNKH